MKSYRLGIDFGTTYSCVGVWKDGGIEIIPNGIGERTTPSVVIFDSPNKVYVGEETLNHISKHNSVKIYEIKRLIGKKYTEIKDILEYFSFNVIKDEDQDKPLIKIIFNNNESINYEPELIVSLILKKLIANAQSYLKTIIKEIIITVPADFNNSQRNAIKYAAELNQGIKVICIINEPSAAVLAYGFPKKFLKTMLFPFNNNYTLLDNIFDLNNLKLSHPMEEDINQILDDKTMENDNLLKLSLKTSFFDQNENKNIIVFDFGGGTYDVSLIEVTDAIFETRASAGNQHLGGGDFDNKLMEHCLKEFIKKNSNISIEEVKKKYKCMERLKIACEQTKKMLSIKENDTIFIEDFYDNKTLDCPITRAFFEHLCDEYFKKLIPPLDKVLSIANIDGKNISEIILVGGSSKIPKIKEILKEKFPSSNINESISPDEAVAYGATIYSESLIRNSGDFWENFGYLDSTQHSYGIEVEDGTMEVIIPSGSKYPTNRDKYFCNAYTDQYTFVIRVFEGENEYAEDNDFLAEFTISNIPKKEKGELILNVSFTIDTNQILNVQGYVAEGNNRESIKIDKKPQFLNNEENSKLILGKITIMGNELSKEEKKIKLEIINYCKIFKNMKTDKDKYQLITNYNNAINRYLSFLEEKCNENKSERYLFLVEKLFKSYSYLYKTHLNAMLDINDKSEIKQKIEQHLENCCNNNPFRVKQLLIHFQDIKKEISDIYFTSIIYCMQLLQTKADEYFINKEKISLQTAKNIYEECLLIGKDLENEELLYLLNDDIIRNYNNIKDHCKTQIKIILVDSFSEIENTKITGKLFSNSNNLDYDNLCLLSYNLKQYLNKLNDIEDLNENEEASEAKSICLALIVKVEILKKSENVNIEKMSDYCQESISIAEKLGEKCTNTEWYNEIKDIYQTKILNNPIPAPPPPDNIFEIEQEMKDNYNNGIDNFLKFLLLKYPIEGYEFSNQIIEEYNKDKRRFFVKLKQKYNRANSFKPSLNGIIDNSYFEEKKKYINQYINNCLNALK